ncbi:MAG: alpha/beta hydrolase fold domain-containing protein [Parvularculaceae bacterium]
MTLRTAARPTAPSIIMAAASCSAISHDPLCGLAHHGGFRVISIDYRLAPEAPFPARSRTPSPPLSRSPKPQKLTASTRLASRLAAIRGRQSRDRRGAPFRVMADRSSPSSFSSIR